LGGYSAVPVVVVTLLVVEVLAVLAVVDEVDALLRVVDDDEVLLPAVLVRFPVVADDPELLAVDVVPVDEEGALDVERLLSMPLLEVLDEAAELAKSWPWSIIANAAAATRRAASEMASALLDFNARSIGRRSGY